MAAAPSPASHLRTLGSCAMRLTSSSITPLGPAANISCREKKKKMTRFGKLCSSDVFVGCAMKSTAVAVVVPVPYETVVLKFGKRDDSALFSRIAPIRYRRPQHNDHFTAVRYTTATRWEHESIDSRTMLMFHTKTRESLTLVQTPTTLASCQK